MANLGFGRVFFFGLALALEACAVSDDPDRISFPDGGTGGATGGVGASGGSGGTSASGGNGGTSASGGTGGSGGTSASGGSGGTSASGGSGGSGGTSASGGGGGSGGTSASGGTGGSGGTSASGGSGGTSASGGSGGSGGTSASGGGGGSGGTSPSGGSGGSGGTGGTSASGGTGGATGGTGGSGGTGGGPVAIGFYDYQAVAPYGMVNPAAVAYHPSGSYALVLNASNTVHKYTTAAGLTQVGSLGTNIYFRDVVFTSAQQAVVLARNSTTNEGRIYVWEDATSTLTELTAERFAGGTYESFRLGPGGAGKLLGSKTNTGSYIAYLWDFSVATGRQNVKAKATSAGCQDLAWATDAFNASAVAVTCGVNGVSLFHVDGGGNFVDHTQNAGNTSFISARPQRDYALAVGWSGSRVYRFQQGLWNTAFGTPQLPGIVHVEFATDGSRALIFGGYGGAPAVGQVYEFRHDLYQQAAITDVSIPSFGLPPYNADSSVQLNDAAWQPGCDGGLLVGGSNTLSSKKAYVIRFSVQNGKACS